MRQATNYKLEKIASIINNNLKRCEKELKEVLREYLANQLNKEVAAKLPKEDILKLGHMTNNYIKTLANKKNKLEAIKDDMKKHCMRNKEYIHFIGKWEDYLKYLEKEIEKL
jgi:cyclopropane fatty-acyl-phospholipid synthase-like methyltransferase